MKPIDPGPRQLLSGKGDGLPVAVARAGASGLFEERYGRLPRGGRLLDLDELLQRFSRLPYENLTKILAWRGGQGAPRLRLPAQVMADHLALGTGGTCFSLTELLRELTARAGFTSHPVMAHMRHGPNIHCALVVTLGAARYLVDPGHLLQQPLALREQPAALSRARRGAAVLLPCGSVPVPSGTPAGDWDLVTLEREGPRWRYRFSLTPPSPTAFSAHWRASFALPAMRSLIAMCRSRPGEILTLYNHQLRRIGERGAVTLKLRQELTDQLQQVFGIDPQVTRQAAEIVAARRARGG